MEQAKNNYSIIISKRATQMLVNHAAFLSQVNEDAAEHLVISFENAAYSLQQMPQRCPWLIGEFIPLYKISQFYSNLINEQILPKGFPPFDLIPLC